MTQEFLLLEDICSILHISKSTAYKLIDLGLLPAYKLGGKWQIKPQDLSNYIENLAHHTADTRT